MKTSRSSSYPRLSKRPDWLDYPLVRFDERIGRIFDPLGPVGLINGDSGSVEDPTPPTKDDLGKLGRTHPTARPIHYGRRVRVITWNMGMANRGQRRPGLHDQAWHYLLGLGPDLAFLQEALPPPWVRGEGTLVHGPFKQWGSAIFSSRFPLELSRLPVESSLRTLGSYIAYGTATLLDGSETFVASVHARAAEASQSQLGSQESSAIRRPSARGVMVNDVAFAGLDEIVRDQPFLAAGDWNTARHQRSERGRKAGAEFFDRARARGWYECSPENGEQRTFFGRSDHPYQDDHVFCDPYLGNSLNDVWVAEAAATVLGLSDHAPLVVDFEMTPISMSKLVDEPEEQ